ncbi:MAG: hypothetical protein IFK94_11030 [Acidobacteria bacterium]|uniref:Uncharacterized protein n=1 Tax=Candidatus Polarisedimenticola svalbardensis TaxID=2886004 RepID=A0A8J6XU35_9BACT|nr:hypothetical protein [Candidatus Polarisedimenticola svalbardensis]
MATEQDPKLAVIRKIDAHRDVMVAEVDVLRYKLRPFGVLGSAAGWIGKAMTFRTPKVSRATSGRIGLDLESWVWLGIPIVRYLLGRRKRR